MTDTLQPSPLAVRISATHNKKRQAEIARVAREIEADLRRKEMESAKPTHQRLKRGDLVQRPLHGADGFIASHNYVKKLDVTKLSKGWPSAISEAYAQFVRDAHALDIQNVTMNYERIGAPVSSGTFMAVGGVGENSDRRDAADRHEFIIRKLHTFDAVGGESVVAILEFVLLHVESVRLGTKRPQDWEDVGRMIEPDYVDPATSKAHARGAFNILGRFMAGCYLEHWAMFGGPLKHTRAKARQLGAL